MRSVSRSFPVLVGFLLVAAPGGAQENPTSPESLNLRQEISLFGEDLEHRLLISGFAVGEYRYDFNTDRNSFGASALAVAFSKVVSDHLSIFAQLTASREAESPFRANEPGSGDIATDIDNLQLSWTPSARSGLEVTFGEFDSPIGIERDDAPLNFQATESFTFQFARPVKFTGVALHEAFSSEFETWAIVANGWDVDRDNNRAKTVALYGLWNPSLSAHVGLGVIHGAEKDDRTGDPRTTAVATLLFQPTPGWVFGGELIAGREPHSAPDGGRAEWYASMLFTHHRFGEHWGVTVRADSLDDRDGSRTGEPQILRSVTVSPQYLIGGGFYGVFRYLDRTSLRLPGVAVRLDLRFDRSSEPAFRSRREDEGRRDHESAVLQVVFLF
ncbi:MAG TPA: outer membrane beta-barrel protein [Thermoanaerobaculia bacterium]